MARYIYQGKSVDQNGKLIKEATISVFQAGTSTVADVYVASSGGSAVNSVTSDSTTASFTFWVDTTDYKANQKFKITVSKTNFQAVSYDNILVFPHEEVGFETFTDGDTAPSVKSSNNFKTANTGATTITGFDDTYNGQDFIVVFGDDKTTIDFGQANLKGNGGANWNPENGDHMDCVSDGTTIYCSISKNVSTGGGLLGV